jgi:hypothetical protein
MGVPDLGKVFFFFQLGSKLNLQFLVWKISSVMAYVRFVDDIRWIIHQFSPLLNVETIILSSSARGVRQHSVPVVRLAERPGLDATTAVAPVSLGLRAFGGGMHQSEHRQSPDQLRTRCPLLRRYEVIFLITYDVILSIMVTYLLSEGLVNTPLAEELKSDKYNRIGHAVFLVMQSLFA